MFNSYLKIGFRNLSKNWLISTINIFGLALAIGCALTVFIFVDSQLNMDAFHSKKDTLYEVINHVSDENGTELWGMNPILLGPNLKSNSAIVENAFRAEFQYGNMRFENEVFNERITFADASLFEMFDFKLAYGTANVLNKRQNMVISQSIAEKYFGDEDPIGQLVSVKFPGDITQSYLIGGLLEKHSTNASFKFDILVPMPNLDDLKKDHTSWDFLTNATFIQLQKGHHSSELNELLEEYAALHNEAATNWNIEKFELVRLDQVALRDYEFRGSISMGGHPAGRVALGITAFILLILACFNYMNIAVASATRRLKEIALRKVMGGHRTHIIHQFLTENLILCFLAMIVGTLLSYYFFLPGFRMMLPFDLPFSFSSFQSAFLFFGGMLLVIGLASGSYPAFYISKFQPSSIFRGSQKLGGNNMFSKILLSMQLVLAFMTVVASFIFSENGKQFATKDWGYDPKGLFTVVVQDEQQYHALEELAKSNPRIKSYSASQHHINEYDPNTTVESLDIKIKSHHYAGAANYPEIMNLRLLEGKYLDEKQNAQSSNSAVINDVFAKKMGWDEPLNKTFSYDSSTYTVVGVVEGFYIYNFHSEIQSAFFTQADPKEFLYFTFKTTEDKTFEVDDQIREAWFDIAPNDPYNRTFQMFAFDGFYRENDSNIALMNVVSFFAIILGCLGLFGLLSFNLQRRMKEFGVRKVLGASRLAIVKQANREYIWMMIISFVLGAPLGWVLMEELLHLIYPDPYAVTVLPFIMSMSIMAFTIGLTVTGQILRATKANPTEVLRSE